MIKLPKEINKSLQAIERAGYEAWAAGEAVCRGLMGQEAEHWMILTSSPAEEVEKLFPQCEKDDGDPRIRYVSDGEFLLTLDCGREPEIEIMRQPFTVLAVADNPARSFLDPAGGRKDVAARLVRSTQEAFEMFRKDPGLIFSGIALAAELDFDIEMNTFTAMKEAKECLAQMPVEDLRDGFGEVLTARFPARGLRFCVAAGLMPYILGEDCYPPKSKHEIESFQTLMEKFDMVRPELEYRYAMVFLCFDEKKAEKAIRRLNFDSESNFKYTSALKKVQELYFVVKPHDFKRFLYQNGWDNYEYWENIAKQQRKVYDHQENRIMSRYYMKQEFEEYKMAIFPEDLAVDADDLKAAGIPENKVDIILEKLLYMVHYKPRLNTKERLIPEAKRYSKNPFVKYLRDVHFYR